MALLELYRRQAGSSRVTPLGVVEPLDVIEGMGSGLLARAVDPPLDALALEQLREAFGHGVAVVAIEDASNELSDAAVMTLLIQGAKSAVLTAHERDDPISRWIQRLLMRMGRQN